MFFCSLSSGGNLFGILSLRDLFVVERFEIVLFIYLFARREIDLELDYF